MAILIDDPKTEETLKELAAVMGEPEGLSVSIALQERLERVIKARNGERVERSEHAHDPYYVRDLMEMSDRIGEKLRPCGRSLDELVGYDEGGLPG